MVPHRSVVCVLIIPLFNIIRESDLIDGESDPSHGGIIHSARPEPSFNGAEGVTLSVIDGASGCDLVLPEGEKEPIVFRGEPEALREWIAAGLRLL